MKLTENKHLSTHKGLKPFTFKRDQLLDIQRRIVGPTAWRKVKIGVQSASIRQFSALQSKFHKELYRIASALNDGYSSLSQATKESSDLFNAYYNKAYTLGAKASGSGITLGYRAKDALPIIYRQEQQWIRTAALQERKFWNKFLDQIDHNVFNTPPLKQTIKGKVVMTPQYLSHFSLPERVKMYSLSLESNFDAGRVAASQNHSVVFWRTTKDDKPCPTCLWLEANSPWPKELMVTTPKAGLCPCRHNCRCSLSIIPKTAKEYQDLKNKKPNKLAIYRLLKKALK